MRRTSAKLLQHYGSMARFTEGGVRADRDECATRLVLEKIPAGEAAQQRGERVR